MDVAVLHLFVGIAIYIYFFVVTPVIPNDMTRAIPSLEYKMPPNGPEFMNRSQLYIAIKPHISTIIDRAVMCAMLGPTPPGIVVPWVQTPWNTRWHGQGVRLPLQKWNWNPMKQKTADLRYPSNT